jgi:hypothetical protein
VIDGVNKMMDIYRIAKQSLHNSSKSYILRLRESRAPKIFKKAYDDLSKQLKNTKKSLEDEIEKAYRKDYFFYIIMK